MSDFFVMSLVCSARECRLCPVSRAKSLTVSETGSGMSRCEDCFTGSDVRNARRAWEEERQVQRLMQQD